MSNTERAALDRAVVEAATAGITIGGYAPLDTNIARIPGDRRNEAFMRAALVLATELGRDRVLEVADKLEARETYTEHLADRNRETVVVLRWCV